ncbi:hypothetical protein PO78_3613 [Thauera sp. SWB20]|nr:hypothetical protein PO78_3613 [Thauera sp. SWB20]
MRNGELLVSQRDRLSRVSCNIACQSSTIASVGRRCGPWRNGDQRSAFGPVAWRRKVQIPVVPMGRAVILNELGHTNVRQTIIPFERSGNRTRGLSPVNGAVPPRFVRIRPAGLQVMLDLPNAGLEPLQCPMQVSKIPECAGHQGSKTQS